FPAHAVRRRVLGGEEREPYGRVAAPRELARQRGDVLPPVEIRLEEELRAPRGSADRGVEEREIVRVRGEALERDRRARGEQRLARPAPRKRRELRRDEHAEQRDEWQRIAIAEGHFEPDGQREHVERDGDGEEGAEPAAARAQARDRRS